MRIRQRVGALQLLGEEPDVCLAGRSGAHVARLAAAWPLGLVTASPTVAPIAAKPITTAMLAAQPGLVAMSHRIPMAGLPGTPLPQEEPPEPVREHPEQGTNRASDRANPGVLEGDQAPSAVRSLGNERLHRGTLTGRL